MQTINRNTKKQPYSPEVDAFSYIDQNSCGSYFSDQSIDSHDTFQDDLSFDYDNIESENSIKKNDNLSTKTLLCSNKRLIGDMSSYHSLPTLTHGKHNDLATITAQTLAQLIQGEFNDSIGKFLILDARYPYEFNGGHILNAQSSFEKETILKQLFNEPVTCGDGKKVIIIFHCEFSIERGPKLMREFREMDRLINKNCYPKLYYPEIYLLEGGYKNFYENYLQMCEPKNYMPMLNDSHRNEMKYFRRKSKTWEETKNSKTRISSRTKLSF